MTPRKRTKKRKFDPTPDGSYVGCYICKVPIEGLCLMCGEPVCDYHMMCHARGECLKFNEPRTPANYVVKGEP